ncbi:hypothetical protein EGR_10939 [Echinococcus granulosus]|uniref:Transmembrane protein n=1 Tax=Echinococcus granulosus TaxID=6210 RepID=W6TZN1_ECHGR|nr:hypothetical protein EGR_10939 [Echinococcus granulosus]EUB54203.1 hypothetical protein EGR_10939 [Echinococcus granulosus]
MHTKSRFGHKVVLTFEMLKDVVCYPALFLLVYAVLILFNQLREFDLRVCCVIWTVTDIAFVLMKNCQNRGCHKAVQTDDYVEEEEEDSAETSDAEFIRLQRILNFFAHRSRSMWTLRLQTLVGEETGGAAADTSYGIEEIPDGCGWEGGGVNKARKSEADKRKRGSKAKCCLMKEENGRMEKEVKEEEVYEENWEDGNVTESRGRSRRCVKRIELRRWVKSGQDMHGLRKTTTFAAFVHDERFTGHLVECEAGIALTDCKRTTRHARNVRLPPSHRKESSWNEWRSRFSCI